MKMQDIFKDTFKTLRHELGNDRPRDQRPMWQVRLSADSDFCRAMVGCGYLTREQMQQAALRYRLGRSHDGGVIFWQIDQLGQVYDGKIMRYLPDGHRDHLRKPSWVSSALKRHYLKDDVQLAAEIPSQHCLFGTHLLREKGIAKSERLRVGELCSGMEYAPAVAVVEAEKTAVILSERHPECLWLAAGGLYELTAVKLFPLQGRRIILFPDTDTEGKAYAIWYKVMQEAQQLLGQTIHLTPLLEQNATPDQKRRKIDIVDYLRESGKL